jgi:hypothetical protein
MKVILSIFLFAALGFKSIPESNVYICDSATAVAYHKTDKFTGIQNCTHTIKSVTLAEAKDTYKRRACKKCY